MEEIRNLDAKPRIQAYLGTNLKTAIIKEITSPCNESSDVL